MSPLRRLGLLGDVHAEDVALAVALRVLADAGAERVLCAGDLVDGPGSVDRCCALLAEAHALVVRGNHERWFLAGTMRGLPEATMSVSAETRRYLASLPPTLTLPSARGELLLCHGLGDDDMASVALDASSWDIRNDPALGALVEREEPLCVLNGHTHRRGVWSRGQLTVINGGTLYREHAPCFGLVDLERDEVRYWPVEAGGEVGKAEVVPLPPRR
jgi:predicted phosphodiesterase